MRQFQSTQPENRSLETSKNPTPRSATPNDAKGEIGGTELSVPQISDQSAIASGSGEKETSTDIATQFRCRICDKPPSVETQPTATFCGHLFCYK